MCTSDSLDLCLKGEASIPERQLILANKKEALLESIEKLQQAVEYIDWKQNFYEEVLTGKTKYYSNLIPEINE